MNSIRAQYGLQPLRANPGLAAAAAQHSREMGVDGYFDHNSANGGAFWQRVAHWYPQGGFARWAVGENLVWSSPDLGSSGVVDLWMHSPEHRANILNPRWRDLGVGERRLVLRHLGLAALRRDKLDQMAVCRLSLIHI